MIIIYGRCGHRQGPGEGGCHKTHHSNGGGGVQHNTVTWRVVKTHHLEMRGGGSKSTRIFYQSNIFNSWKQVMIQGGTLILGHEREVLL